MEEKLKRSLVSPDVRVESCAAVEESILLEGVRIGEGARIKRCIIDKHSKYPPAWRLAIISKRMRNDFTVTTSGIVVVPKGFRAQ